MNKLTRVVDAARMTNPRLADALEDMFRMDEKESDGGMLFPDSSRTLTLNSGRLAVGVVLRIGSTSFDVIEVSDVLQEFLFIELKGHEVLGLSPIFQNIRGGLAVTYRGIPFSNVAGNAADVRLIDAF